MNAAELEDNSVLPASRKWMRRATSILCQLDWATARSSSLAGTWPSNSRSYARVVRVTSSMETPVVAMFPSSPLREKLAVGKLRFENTAYRGKQGSARQADGERQPAIPATSHESDDEAGRKGAYSTVDPASHSAIVERRQLRRDLWDLKSEGGKSVSTNVASHDDAERTCHDG